MGYKQNVPYLIDRLAIYFANKSDQILLERYGISMAQYRLLMVLNEQPGIQQKEIAANLAQTEASISRQIGILVDKNLVEIGQARDNRKHLIYITRKGQEMFIKASNALDGFYLSEFDNLSNRDIEHLKTLLQKLHSSF